MDESVLFIVLKLIETFLAEKITLIQISYDILILVCSLFSTPNQSACIHINVAIDSHALTDNCLRCCRFGNV